MNQSLKITFFLGLSFLLCLACGNTNEQKTETTASVALSKTEETPVTAETPETSTAPQTAAAAPNSNASTHDHPQATQKASKTVELPQQKELRELGATKKIQMKSWFFRTIN